MRFVVLYGPPGCGKVMRAREMASALPGPTGEDLTAVAWIQHGVHGLSVADSRVRAPAFRAPHHTVSETGLIGLWERRRSNPHARMFPGEATLAHAGCLLLDELPEFRLSALDALGRALYAGKRTFWHHEDPVSIPAAPALVIATANPCDCGWADYPGRTCKCGEARVARYLERLHRCLYLVSRERSWEWFRGSPIELTAASSSASPSFSPMAGAP